MKTLFLEKMSWPEIKQALENGFKTVIIPAGSVEQHGPHLAECTDTYVAEAIAIRLAERLGKTLVAPAIRPGLSLHHMTFPSTVTLRPTTFTAILEDYIDCYVKNGFKNIIMFSGHGGNYRSLDAIAIASRDKYPELTIFNVINIKDMEVILPDMERSENLPKGAIGMGHACDYETSMMLALHPDLVNMEVAGKGNTSELTDDTLEKLYRDGISAITENGVLGDPSAATADRGERHINRLVYECEKKVRAITDI